jgi:hypothetical protein
MTVQGAVPCRAGLPAADHTCNRGWGAVGSSGCVGEGQRPSPPLLTPPSSPIRELGGGRWVGGGSMIVQGAVLGCLLTNHTCNRGWEDTGQPRLCWGRTETFPPLADPPLPPLSGSWVGGGGWGGGSMTVQGAVLSCLLPTIPVTGDGQQWAAQAVLGKDRDLPPLADPPFLPYQGGGWGEVGGGWVNDGPGCRAVLGCLLTDHPCNRGWEDTGQPRLCWGRTETFPPLADPPFLPYQGGGWGEVGGGWVNDSPGYRAGRQYQAKGCDDRVGWLRMISPEQADALPFLGKEDP